MCATELGYVAKVNHEFAKRGCKVIGLSVDKVEDHKRWASDIEDLAGTKLNFPIIADENLDVAKLYDMLPADSGNTSEGRTAVDNQTVRSVFLVGPDKKIKLTLTYPMSSGRNFDELLRVLDSVRLTAKHKVGDASELAEGRGRDHPPSGQQRGSEGVVSRRLGNREAVPEEGEGPQLAPSAECRYRLRVASLLFCVHSWM